MGFAFLMATMQSPLLTGTMCSAVRQYPVTDWYQLISHSWLTSNCPDVHACYDAQRKHQECSEDTMESDTLCSKSSCFIGPAHSYSIKLFSSFLYRLAHHHLNRHLDHHLNHNLNHHPPTSPSMTVWLGVGVISVKSETGQGNTLTWGN